MGIGGKLKSALEGRHSREADKTAERRPKSVPAAAMMTPPPRLDRPLHSKSSSIHDAGRMDMGRIDPGRLDPGRIGSSRIDMPRNDSPRNDMPQHDSPRSDSFRNDPRNMARNDSPRNDTFGIRKITKEVERRGHFHSDSGVGLREPEVVEYGFSNFGVGPGHSFGDEMPETDLGGPRQHDLDLRGPPHNDSVEQLLAPDPAHDPEFGQEDEIHDDGDLGTMAAGFGGSRPGHGSGGDALSDSDFGDPRHSVSGDWLRYADLLNAHHSSDALPAQGLTEPGHSTGNFGLAESPSDSPDPQLRGRVHSLSAFGSPGLGPSHSDLSDPPRPNTRPADPYRVPDSEPVSPGHIAALGPPETPPQRAIPPPPPARRPTQRKPGPAPKPQSAKPGGHVYSDSGVGFSAGPYDDAGIAPTPPLRTRGYADLDHESDHKFSPDPMARKFSPDPMERKLSPDPMAYKFSIDPMAHKFSDPMGRGHSFGEGLPGLREAVQSDSDVDAESPDSESGAGLPDLGVRHLGTAEHGDSDVGLLEHEFAWDSKRDSRDFDGGMDGSDLDSVSSLQSRSHSIDRLAESIEELLPMRTARPYQPHGGILDPDESAGALGMHGYFGADVPRGPSAGAFFGKGTSDNAYAYESSPGAEMPMPYRGGFPRGFGVYNTVIGKGSNEDPAKCRRNVPGKGEGNVLWTLRRSLLGLGGHVQGNGGYSRSTDEDYVG